MIKKLLSAGTALIVAFYLLVPSAALAAGMSVGGGGTYTAGQNFTITVNASGASFTALEGVIQVSGPVTIVSFSPGAATWLPGMSPANGKKFAGAVSQTGSLRVATITLRGTAVGSGKVTVSGVQLAKSGSVVGTSGGTTNFTITRAPTPPGGVEVASPTHPDQNEFYGATSVTLSWSPPANGADGYATLLDQAAETDPGQTVTTAETTATYNNLELGTHYFHIRAHNGDGWSGVTHFKINIKEELDETLVAPVITGVTKTANFATSIENGTVSGFVISGTSSNLLGYNAVVKFDPAKTAAEQVLSIAIREDGTWELPIDQPLPTGFYKLTSYAKKDKTISKDSEPVYLEVSVANGGEAKLISAADLPEADKSMTVLGVTFNDQVAFWWSILGIFAFTAVFTLIAYALRQWYKKLKAKRAAKSKTDDKDNKIPVIEPPKKIT